MTKSHLDVRRWISQNSENLVSDSISQKNENLVSDSISQKSHMFVVRRRSPHQNESLFDQKSDFRRPGGSNR